MVQLGHHGLRDQDGKDQPYHESNPTKDVKERFGQGLMSHGRRRICIREYVYSSSRAADIDVRKWFQPMPAWGGYRSSPPSATEAMR